MGNHSPPQECVLSLWDQPAYLYLKIPGGMGVAGGGAIFWDHLPATNEDRDAPQRKPQLINAKSNQLWGNQLQLTHDTMQPLYLREHHGRRNERARGPVHLLWASVFYMQQGSCIHEASTIWLPCLRPKQRQHQLKCQREWGRSHGVLPLHEELLAINGYWVFPIEEALPGYLIPSRS